MNWLQRRSWNGAERNDRNSLRQQGICPPFPFPPRASRGGWGSPHAGRHAARQEKALGTHRCRRLPPKRAAAPLGIPCECAGAEVCPEQPHVYGSKTAENRRRRWRIDYTKTRNCACCKKKEKPPRRLDLTVPSHGSHAWVAMRVQTKSLRLFREVAIGYHIDGWRVCWIGGGTNAGCCSRLWWNGQSHPARCDWPGVLPRRKIDRAEPPPPARYLSGAALFIDPTARLALLGARKTKPQSRH
jgi:hypothetical protein